MAQQRSDTGAYRTLAARNVRTVVDLRAEDDVREDGEFLLGLGVELVRFPIRDGQTPSAVQANQFIEAVQSFEGVVLSTAVRESVARAPWPRLHRYRSTE